MTALADVWIQPWRHEQASLPEQQDLVTIPALKSLRLDIELKQFEPMDKLKCGIGSGYQQRKIGGGMADLKALSLK